MGKEVPVASELGFLLILFAVFPLLAVAEAGEFGVTSPAFRNGERIPDLYTCKGEDISPPLSWTHPPAGTRSIALIVDDPDAPGGVFTHWIVWNIPSSLRALPQGVRVKTLDPDIREGRNDFGTIGYRGPCPPRGHGVHHYRFRLFALREPLPLDLPEGASAREVHRFLSGRVIGEAVLVGTYSR
jgi:Raf kinase inhibitor-like YbhB/YbcL family protein